MIHVESIGIHETNIIILYIIIFFSFSFPYVVIHFFITSSILAFQLSQTSVTVSHRLFYLSKTGYDNILAIWLLINRR